MCSVITLWKEIYDCRSSVSHNLHFCPYTLFYLTQMHRSSLLSPTYHDQLTSVHYIKLNNSQCVKWLWDHHSCFVFRTGLSRGHHKTFKRQSTLDLSQVTTENTTYTELYLNYHLVFMVFTSNKWELLQK